MIPLQLLKLEEAVAILEGEGGTNIFTKCQDLISFTSYRAPQFCSDESSYFRVDHIYRNEFSVRRQIRGRLLVQEIQSSVAPQWFPNKICLPSSGHAQSPAHSARLSNSLHSVTTRQTLSFPMQIRGSELCTATCMKRKAQSCMSFSSPHSKKLFLLTVVVHASAARQSQVILKGDSRHCS